MIAEQRGLNSGLSETGFLCIALTVGGTHSVDRAGLELTEIFLPLPPECWDLLVLKV